MSGLVSGPMTKQMFGLFMAMVVMSFGMALMFRIVGANSFGVALSILCILNGTAGAAYVTYRISTAGRPQ